MAFGFEHGDGWYDIIYKLSEKLEAKAKQLKDEDKKSETARCLNCGCLRTDHYACATDKPKKCLSVKKLSTKRKYRSFRATKFWQRPFMWSAYQAYRLWEKVKKLVYYKLQACWCEGYDPAIPLASQVKEKYGTLRFYMDCTTDEMQEWISEAERQTETTCEKCGEPGVLRGPGWYFTACKAHAINASGEYVKPVGADEDES